MDQILVADSRRCKKSVTGLNVGGFGATMGTILAASCLQPHLWLNFWTREAKTISFPLHAVLMILLGCVEPARFNCVFVATGNKRN